MDNANVGIHLFCDSERTREPSPFFVFGWKAFVSMYQLLQTLGCTFGQEPRELHVGVDKGCVHWVRLFVHLASSEAMRDSSRNFE